MKKYKLTPLGKFVIGILILFMAVTVVISLYGFSGFCKKTLATVGMSDITKSAFGLKAEIEKEQKATIEKKSPITSLPMLTLTPTPIPTLTPTPTLMSTPIPTQAQRLTPTPTLINIPTITPMPKPEPTVTVKDRPKESTTKGAVAVKKNKIPQLVIGFNYNKKLDEIIRNVINKIKNTDKEKPSATDKVLENYNKNKAGNEKLDKINKMSKKENSGNDNKEASKKDNIKNTKAVESEARAILGLKDLLTFVPSDVEKKDTKETKKSNVEIFYIPHPDDELLSMGVAIAESIRKGKEVHLVLYTHGYESSAIKIINGEVYCKWHKKVHNPKFEGYGKLTEKDFGKYRVKEYINSATCLGVDEKNIHIMNFYEDSITPYEVKLVMLGFEKQFPDAIHNAASYQDKHPFHKKIGVALLELYKNKEVKTARFFISPVQWSSISGETVSNEQLAEKIKKCIGIYKLWEPEKEHFGIGYHSYQTPFDSISNKIISKYHNPSN